MGEGKDEAATTPVASDALEELRRALDPASPEQIVRQTPAEPCANKRHPCPGFSERDWAGCRWRLRWIFLDQRLAWRTLMTGATASRAYR